MLPRKFLEIVCQDADSPFGFGRLSPSGELQKQTFLQIACAHACRVEVLDDGKYMFNFFFRHVVSGLENQIVRNGGEVAPEIPVVVYISYNIFGNLGC